jgi:hypothetical protein
MLKLKSLLTENPAGALGGASDMAKKVTSRPLAQSVSMLQKLAADPDTKDILLKGKEDGDIKDEQIKVTPENVGLTDLYPTQAEIGFGNSLDDIVFDKYEVIDKCFDPPVKLGPPPGSPLLCARIGAKIYVLDGHHRWSAAFMCNRNAKMECDIMEMPSGETAESALRLMQVAILAKAGKVKTKNFEGQDLMATSTDKVESYVVEKIVDSAIEKFGIFSKGKLTDGTMIATEIGAAHKVIKSMKGKFPRNIMPQADHSGGDGTQDKVNQALAQGDINWKEPFVSEGRIKLKNLLK